MKFKIKNFEGLDLTIALCGMARAIYLGDIGIKYIYENLYNIEQPRVRKLLENGYESAILPRRLVMQKVKDAVQD